MPRLLPRILFVSPLYLPPPRQPDTATPPLAKLKWLQAKFSQPAQGATVAAAKLMTWLGKATCGMWKTNGQGAMEPLWRLHNSLNRSPGWGPG